MVDRGGSSWQRLFVPFKPQPAPPSDQAPCRCSQAPAFPRLLQGSATSVRTPSIKRGLQGASTRAGRMRTALLSHREESVLGSRRNRWAGGVVLAACSVMV